MPEVFDLFCFEHCDSMLDILTDPIITVVDAGDQLILDYPDPPGTSCDLGVLSGELANGAFPEDDVRVSAEPTSGVGTRWTLQWNVIFESLPDDFDSLVAQHVYIGASDASGPCAGLFISDIGVAYTGSVHHVSDDLVTDSAVTAIPGTAQYIALDVETTFRLVVDGLEGVVYLFITDAADVPLTGHRLVAILPVLDAADMSFPPVDQALISVRGTTTEPSRVAFDQWCMSSALLIPNLPPVANAGTDQAVRFCSVAQLDGSASFDPEDVTVTYSWRLINAPIVSSFSVSGNDGHTHALLSPTGFTDKFHSTALGLVHAADNLDAGDVLLVDALPYEIVSTGTDGNGFFVLTTEQTIPDAFTAKPFRVFRQRGISGPTTVKPTFFPDVLGFYRFDLIVSDGDLDSLPSVVVINVVDSPLPRGIVPDANFIFDYLSDYWSLVEDRDPIATIWSGLAQVAASELYTLWQHDYGKSLRDVQRTFIRRWLHYDLLLGEPLPELTTLRVFYGGRSTSSMAAVGVGGISGTSFVVSSGVHAPKTVSIISANNVTAPVLAAEVRNRLLEADSRYTTQVITLLSGQQSVRINAPFPFTISSSSVPVLSNGASNLAAGTGAVIGPRTYKVDTSLDGLGLQENDLLVLGTEAFRISQLADDPADDFRFQRVILKSDIDASVTTNWTLSGYVRSELLDFYNGLVSRGDAVFFEVVDYTSNDPSDDDSTLLQAEALGVAADEVSNLGFTIPTALGDAIATPSRFQVRLAKIVRRTYLPIDTMIVDIPTLTELIVIKDDTETLRRNVDFYIEDYRGRHALHFESGQLGGGDVWEEETPPDRLWAEYSYLDNRETIEDNFGLLAEVTADQIAALPGNVDYLSAVRGIWYAYVNGPTLFNLRAGAQILLGLPFAEKAGTIEEIRTDFSPTFGRILIRDSERTEIVRSYTFPRSLSLETNPATSVAYIVGDTVRQFAPLVQGVEVVDYVKDPTWFQGLLNQGIFYEIEKYWRFLVRVDSAAFGLESLSFVRDFILKIKPASTYPFFLVGTDLGADTEVSITDIVNPTITVNLLDTVCGDLTPFSTSFDDARSGGGGYWNQFDTDSDDSTDPPDFDTSDAVEWAFDRYVLCPDDGLESYTTQIFTGTALASTGLNFVPADDLYNISRFMEAGPFVVANGAVGEAITAEVGDTLPANGTIDRLRVILSGGPGAALPGYEVVIAINGTDQITQAITSVALYTDVSFVVSEAVVATDVVTAFIRHASGAPRSPDWTHVRIEVYTNLGAWVGGDSLDEGNYGFARTLV